MRTLILIILALITTACGRAHGYKVGHCFELDKEHKTFHKIVNIDDDKYSVKFMITDLSGIPSEYRDLADAFPLPTKIPFDKFDLDEKLIPITCPR